MNPSKAIGPEGACPVPPSWCWVLLLLVFSVVPGVFAADAAERPPLNGTWSWSFTMRDGSRIEPKAKLKQDGETVTGVSILSAGQETPIVDGKIENQTVQWSVVREHNGRKVKTRYQGKLAGDTLKGFIESDWAGEVHRYDWEARRAPDTPAGIWRWASGSTSAEAGRRPGGRGNPGDSRGGYRGTFKLEGERVTGRIALSGRESEIKHGRFRNREFSFQIVRERDGEKVLTQYRGQIEGDTIKGQIESASGGETRTRAWEATRIDVSR